MDSATSKDQMHTSLQDENLCEGGEGGRKRKEAGHRPTRKAEAQTLPLHADFLCGRGSSRLGLQPVLLSDPATVAFIN